MIRERIKRGERSYTLNRYKRGEGCVVVCISLPPGDIQMIDETAEDLRMSRSKLIREAVREYVERRR